MTFSHQAKQDVLKPPSLKHFASLWTLQHYPEGGEHGEWSLDAKLAAIKAAGFDGFQWFAQPEFAELSGRHGLAFLGGCAASAGDYLQRLKEFAPLKPVRINIQLGDHAMPPAEAVTLWLQMNRIADDLGLVLDLETHRGTCTETPEKTWQIAELYAQKTGRTLRLTFDFSHFAVVKHGLPPYADSLLGRPDLLAVCRQLHLRPFNGHHCEIPATDGKGARARWAKPWFDFVESLLACWRQQNQGTTEPLWICPEFGAMTSGYWLSDFPDPWQDALFVKQEVQHLWDHDPIRKTI